VKRRGLLYLALGLARRGNEVFMHRGEVSTSELQEMRDCFALLNEILAEWGLQKTKVTVDLLGPKCHCLEVRIVVSSSCFLFLFRLELSATVTHKFACSAQLTIKARILARRSTKISTPHTISRMASEAVNRV